MNGCIIVFIITAVTGFVAGWSCKKCNCPNVSKYRKKIRELEQYNKYLLEVLHRDTNGVIQLYQSRIAELEHRVQELEGSQNSKNSPPKIVRDLLMFLDGLKISMGRNRNEKTAQEKVARIIKKAFPNAIVGREIDYIGNGGHRRCDIVVNDVCIEMKYVTDKKRWGNVIRKAIGQALEYREEFENVILFIIADESAVPTGRINKLINHYNSILNKCNVYIATGYGV